VFGIGLGFEAFQATNIIAAYRAKNRVALNIFSSWVHTSFAAVSAAVFASRSTACIQALL
jgi:hypothetical protein